MAAALTQVLDPYMDGLGRSSQLGVCFLRRVRIDFNDGTTATVAATDLGVAKIVRCVSIVPLTAGSAYVSSEAEDEFEFTASANTVDCDVFLLCSGL